MNEILLIDKPKGWTSFDVVARIRGQIKRETGAKKPKVGHAGTLDPLASGLLIVLVGSATKKQDEFMKKDKVYEVEMKLGETSTTGDEEGTKSKISGVQPSREALLAALQRFHGEIMQKPHKYSAVKINGQRAYKLARAGKTVEIEPRKVTIYEITGVEYVYPLVKFIAKVSSGTYIRSLVEDIGTELGTGAYMTNLRRTEVGGFKVQDAKTIEQVV